MAEVDLNRPSSSAGVPGAKPVGRLTRVDARGVWAHEEYDFTPWLLDNSEYLSEALGIDVSLESAEFRVGPFELDLIGQDVSNDAVLIVENQLAATDHNHLGQLLTYAAGTDAGTIVWIATRFGEQHRQAVDWLNQRTDQETHFFAVELELLTIGDSLPAPHFKVVAAPNEWQKSARQAGQSAKSGGPKAAMYSVFWPKLISRFNDEHPGWTRRRPDGGPFRENWLSMPCPIACAQFSLSFARGDRLRHEIYIDGGDATQNLEIFRSLEARREILDGAFGRALEYEELPTRSACRVADYRDGSPVTEEDMHEVFIEWFVDSGERFRRALLRLDE